LRATALGRLVQARASEAAGPVDDGLADLRRGTLLALTHVAADRDKEQIAWSDLRRETAAELGIDGDPVVFLLQRARERLTGAAGDDRAAGGALLAYQASRWLGACEPTPCQGVDRVDGMRAASRWHADLEGPARTWQVLALKAAIDGLDVGRDTVMYPRSMLDLADALLGTGAGPLDASILRRKGEAAVWLSLGRAVGRDGTVDWADARVAGAHLAAEARAAAKVEQDPAVDALLERIAARAIP
jgi:hypothetical protein